MFVIQKGMFIYNMDAHIDTIRSAIKELGFGPSRGDTGDIAAMKENAKTYYTRLIERE